MTKNDNIKPPESLTGKIFVYLGAVYMGSEGDKNGTGQNTGW